MKLLGKNSSILCKNKKNNSKKELLNNKINNEKKAT